jgi:prepilin-type N-terminal cleavage/methylation domain-containing protein
MQSIKTFFGGKKAKNSRKGFTLIEILVVIGIIAILAAIVIIAINPAKQFAQARNTQRTSNVNAVLNAIGQRLADNKGTFAGTFTVGAATYTCGTLPTASTTITTTQPATPATVSAGLGCLVPTYMATLPTDPDSTIVAPSTGYDVSVDAAGRVMVCADKAKSETSIPDASGICVVR